MNFLTTIPLIPTQSQIIRLDVCSSGRQTTDEMGELWIQAVPRSREDFKLLSQAYNAKELEQDGDGRASTS